MNSLKVSYISRTLLSFLFVAGLILTPNLVQAQEQSQEEKEYEAYQKIAAEKDIAQKVDLVVTFLKESPKSQYKPNVIAEYQNAVLKLREEKKWQQVVSACEKFIRVDSDDAFSIGALTVAYAETKNSKGFVAFAEKSYASKPSGELAYAIAKGYLELKNDAKFLQWAEKTLASNPDKMDLTIELTKRALAVEDHAKATKYAKMTLSALQNAKKPESVDAQAWKTTTDLYYAVSYAALGAASYSNRNYPDAINNLTNAVKYYKRMSTAYYFLGMSFWQQNKIAQAQLNFAKAYVIDGNAAAKKQLDTLWSQSHGGSLAGMQVVIDRARQELK